METTNSKLHHFHRAYITKQINFSKPAQSQNRTSAKLSQAHLKPSVKLLGTQSLMISSSTLLIACFALSNKKWPCGSRLGRKKKLITYRKKAKIPFHSQHAKNQSVSRQHTQTTPLIIAAKGLLTNRNAKKPLPIFLTSKRLST